MNPGMACAVWPTGSLKTTPEMCAMTSFSSGLRKKCPPGKIFASNSPDVKRAHSSVSSAGTRVSCSLPSARIGQARGSAVWFGWMVQLVG
jgi:hypothetical protein